jgi:hypothetical protein
MPSPARSCPEMEDLDFIVSLLTRVVSQSRHRTRLPTLVVLSYGLIPCQATGRPVAAACCRQPGGRRSGRRERRGPA